MAQIEGDDLWFSPRFINELHTILNEKELKLIFYGVYYNTFKL